VLATHKQKAPNCVGCVVGAASGQIRWEESEEIALKEDFDGEIPEGQRVARDPGESEARGDGR
jgi:hypothetical protein